MFFSLRAHHRSLSYRCCLLTLLCAVLSAAGPVHATPGVRDRVSRLRRVGRRAGGQAGRRRDQGDGGGHGGSLGSVNQGGRRSERESERVVTRTHARLCLLLVLLIFCRFCRRDRVCFVQVIGFSGGRWARKQTPSLRRSWSGGAMLTLEVAAGPLQR